MNNVKKQIKIIATIGPATHSPDRILDLAKAGVNIFRINLSHATDQEISERFKWIKLAEDILGVKLEILGDLPGPKIRINDVAKNVILEKGQKYYILKNKKNGDVYGCGLNYPKILDVLTEGAKIFIDDGQIQLIVDKKTSEGLETTVVVGGHLTSRKGFLAEGISISLGSVSTRDKRGIKQMIREKPDYLAISFVETKKDIEEIKKLLPKNFNAKLIAKIETCNGVVNAEDILSVSSGLMVARGDLGLAMPIFKVPRIQKDLIRLCNQEKKFVITATHMLESMINKPLPTRAEVSDVANAIWDGTDAVMLSGESAIGKYPIEAVTVLQEMIDEISF